jgi:CO/xanthine dehydrogenase FAD-binding subunit
MIKEYYRPQDLKEALVLLSRDDPETIPLGGGTVVSKQQKVTAVVDLQALGLNKISVDGNKIVVGASATLQSLVEAPEISPVIKQAVMLEVSLNIRNMATVGGVLKGSNGRSALLAVLSAMDTRLTWEPGGQDINLTDFLALRGTYKKGLITSVTFPAEVETKFEMVQRTPGDLPIVLAAVTKWASGRTRLVLGGYGKTPSLVFDGTDKSGAEAAARSAYSKAEDEWASAEYRAEMAALLTKRLMA